MASLPIKQVILKNHLNGNNYTAYVITVTSQANHYADSIAEMTRALNTRGMVGGRW